MTKRFRLPRLPLQNANPGSWGRVKNGHQTTVTTQRQRIRRIRKRSFQLGCSSNGWMSAAQMPTSFALFHDHHPQNDIAVKPTCGKVTHRYETLSIAAVNNLCRKDKLLDLRGTSPLGGLQTPGVAFVNLDASGAKVPSCSMIQLQPGAPITANVSASLAMVGSEAAQCQHQTASFHMCSIQ